MLDSPTAYLYIMREDRIVCNSLQHREYLLQLNHCYAWIFWHKSVLAPKAENHDLPSRFWVFLLAEHLLSNVVDLSIECFML